MIAGPRVLQLQDAKYRLNIKNTFTVISKVLHKAQFVLKNEISDHGNKLD